MTGYVIRRMLLMIPSLILLTMIVFTAVRFIPGSVLELMLSELLFEGGNLGQTITVDDVKERLGMDVPIHVQYGRWVGVAPQKDGSFSGVIQGSLGKSLWTQRPINDEIGRRLPITLELGTIAIIISIIWALPIGIYSAIRQDTLGDYAGRSVAIIAISVPSFWLATILMIYPSIWWNWMPNVEFVPFNENPVSHFGQFIIPSTLMAVSAAGTKMRISRTMMLEVLRQDYIRTAWSKGLTERVVIWRHALKNAMIPVITVIGQQAVFTVGGTVVMEAIFSIPGMGLYMIEALGARDYPVIIAINLVVATFVMVINLMVDLTYAWFDPRIHYR